MPATETLIIRGKRMACPRCNKMQSFFQDYSQELAPYTISCPFCQWNSIILPQDREYRNLPKVDLSVPVHGYWVIESVEKATGEAVGQLASEIQTIPESLRMSSFSKRLDEAAVSFVSGLQIIQSLKDDLDQVALHFKEEIETVHDQASSFRLGWNPKMLPLFLLRPFAAIPAHPLDTDLNHVGCFYLLSPKFYYRLHGLPLSTAGGFYLQLITPYTQMGLPIERWMRDHLGMGIKEPPDLRFHYSKIVGKSLHDYWKQIDGVIIDEDHSDRDPSVLVENKRRARTWLVKRGVPAWSFNPTSKTDLFPATETMMKAGEEKVFYEAYQLFMRTGRMALGWKYTDDARSFALYLGTAFKGFKLIIGGTIKDKLKGFDYQTIDSWRDKLSTRKVRRNDHVFHHWSDFRTLEGLSEFDLVMVDVAGGVPLEFLDRLHDYSGRLILILGDPLMDTLEENEIAPAVYSLCNSVHYHAGEQDWKEPWKEVERKVPEALARCLKTLGVE
jgi:hypothetical protein